MGEEEEKKEEEVKEEGEEEEREEEEVEDKDEVLLAMMARLGCERIILKGVESNPDAGRITSSSLSVLDDESSQTPATASGSHTPSQQMQEDHHQPPFSYH